MSAGADENELPERYPTMPRRLDPKPCACGCGQITKSGEFMRGHHTRRRWELVKAVVQNTETGSAPVIAFGTQLMTAQRAGEELARRGWLIPDTHRHFGVELEVIATSQAQLVNIFARLGIRCGTGGYHATGERGAWMVTRDGSLRANPAQTRRGMMYTAEIVSPPLRGKKGIAELRKVMTALEAAGVDVNKTCGGHVHHEARDFDLQGFKRLAATYSTLQTAIDRTMPVSRRAGGSSYCQPLRSYELTGYAGATNLRDFVGVGDKYRVLNFLPYTSHGTVEFRQHAGTVSADKMVNWILFTQALVKASKKGLSIAVDGSLARAAASLGLHETAGYFTARERSLSRSAA